MAEQQNSLGVGCFLLSSPFARVSPAHLIKLLQLPDEQVERQTDQANHYHAGDDEIVTFSGVTCVDDEITQTAVDRDHFRGYDHEPGDTKRDANPGDDLWQTGAQNNLPKEFTRTKAERLRRAKVNQLHVLHCSNGLNCDRENARQEN